MYSAYKLNTQGDNIQPWNTPFPIRNQSVVPCLVLTVASRPAYRFLRRQVRWSGIPISWRIFHSFLYPHSQRLYCSQWSRSRCFSGIPLLFYDPTDVDNFISGSSALSKPNLYIWKFSIHVLLKPNLKDFEHFLSNMWNEYNYVVVWTFFGTALLWDWNENWPFPDLWPLPSFPSLLTCWVQHFIRIWNSSTGIPSPPLAL